MDDVDMNEDGTYNFIVGDFYWFTDSHADDKSKRGLFGESYERDYEGIFKGIKTAVNVVPPRKFYVFRKSRYFTEKTVHPTLNIDDKDVFRIDVLHKIRREGYYSDICSYYIMELSEIGVVYGHIAKSDPKAEAKAKQLAMEAAQRSREKKAQQAAAQAQAQAQAQAEPLSAEEAALNKIKVAKERAMAKLAEIKAKQAAAKGSAGGRTIRLRKRKVRRTRRSRKTTRK
jgi:hypothetical protein